MFVVHASGESQTYALDEMPEYQPQVLSFSHVLSEDEEPEEDESCLLSSSSKTVLEGGGVGAGGRLSFSLLYEGCDE